MSGRVASGLLISALVAACKTAAPTVQKATPAEPVILTLGNKGFTTDDFFQSYTKNQISGDSAQRTDLKGYLDLYTNLKLKVLAAEQEGRDTTESFREEIETYRKQLAQSYLTDKALVEQLSEEAYQRMQEEVNASHILIAVAEDALPADTLAAFQTVQGLRERLLKGEDFAALARQYSKDPTVVQNSGSLGYFSAFQTVYPFETAAYTTPVGNVSQPVRSRSGYHLIKVNDRRSSRGKIQVAHIMVRISPSADEAGQTAAKARIDEIYNRLQKGGAFDGLAREFSDDAQSKSNGGLLPTFATGQMVPTFEDAAFGLSTPGSYSKPIKTNYGWHILKLVERKPLEPYTELAPALRQKVVTDSRADLIRQATVQRLQKEYSVKPNESVLKAALAKADSSLLQGKWNYQQPLEASLDGKTLVSVNNQPATVNQFFAYVRQKQQPRTAGSAPGVVMQRLFDRFVGDQLIAVEEANLENKYTEFRALLNEIRDGVLLSQMMEQNVWEKSMADSLGQRQYYEQNKQKYGFPERAFATVVVASNDDMLQQARQTLASSPYQLRRSAPEIVYARNKTTLDTKQKEALYDILVTMVRNPEYVIEVSGSREASEKDTVSAGRIRSVVSYLMSNGVSVLRIIEKDHGAFRPGSKAGAKDAADQRRITFQYFSTAKKDVEKVLNAKNANAVTITEGVFAEGTNPHLDSVEWKPGTTILHPDNKSVLVIINRVEKPRLKTFDEARGAVINDYQAFLEKQWLAQLKQRFPVQINEDEMRKLIK
ncbi:peptidylprolyl isomerase [Nibrella saemangeumensis]